MRTSSSVARAGAAALALIVAAAVTAGASRYPLARSAPVNAASAPAPITALYAIVLAAGILFLTGLAAIMWPGRRRRGDEEPEFVSEPPGSTGWRIAAYAAMQDTLAAEGIARGRTEAPREYLQRVLTAGAATQPEAGTLTGLFEQARFSTQPISARMQDSASRTLASLQARLAAEEQT